MLGEATLDVSGTFAGEAIRLLIQIAALQRAALRDRRGILGPVAYARHMHELDADERDAKAILRRAQLRVVAGTAVGE
jgi:hypothetical protein